MVKFVRSRLALAALASAAGLVLATAACNSFLGINSAALDPTFDMDGGRFADTGTGGDSAPSSPCAAYCSAVVKACPGAEYNDVPTCLSFCGALDPGQSTDTNKDSLGCRAHYAELAVADASNCPAAGPLGGGVCGNDLCTTFCTLDTYVCTGSNQVFDGGELGCGAACQSNFDTYLTDAGNDLALSSGNTLNCRIWHLQAAVNPAVGPSALVTHCPHTAVISSFCHN